MTKWVHKKNRESDYTDYIVKDPTLKTTFRTLLSQKKSIQQDLADFCKVDKSTISKIVNGIYIPDLIMKLKIAEFFDVDTRVIWRDKKEIEINGNMY
jgi:DNA-binding XRE family transcriptional regulator|tara:strand:+ start:195 stop:485 length:291 start_codon:yes stop_codon:yes gene_type:complete